MDWQDGPAPYTGAAVQAFDVGFLRHAVVDEIEEPDQTFSESYAASAFAAGPRRVVRFCRLRNGEAIGSPWQLQIEPAP